MKTLLVSLYPPNEYGGKIGGVVILLHDILSVATNPVDIVVYNDNDGDFNLPSNVTFIPWNTIAICKQKKKKSFKYSLFQDYKNYIIDAQGYDKIVIYPYFSSLFNYENFYGEFYTIGMDSGSLLYLRGVLYNSKLKYKLFSLFRFYQALKIDFHAVKMSKKIFTVGEMDAAFYKAVLLSDAQFVHHPVSKLIEKYSHKAWTGEGELKICFPGGMTPFYVPNLADEILTKFLNEKEKYCGKVSISFLGRMPSGNTEQLLARLDNAGIKTEKLSYVDDFEDYISKQDVVILPLEVGVGTKNKALTTLGMGVDLIGSPIAVENVYGVKPENCEKNATGFMKLIDLRLENKCLYNLSDKEIVAFKEYHSVIQWQKNFWEKIYESEY